MDASKILIAQLENSLNFKTHENKRIYNVLYFSAFISILPIAYIIDLSHLGQDTNIPLFMTAIVLIMFSFYVWHTVEKIDNLINGLTIHKENYGDLLRDEKRVRHSAEQIIKGNSNRYLVKNLPDDYIWDMIERLNNQYISPLNKFAFYNQICFWIGIILSWIVTIFAFIWSFVLHKESNICFVISFLVFISLSLLAISVIFLAGKFDEINRPFYPRESSKALSF